MTISTYLRPKFFHQSVNGDVTGLGVHGGLVVATLPRQRFSFHEQEYTVLLRAFDVFRSEVPSLFLNEEEIKYFRHHYRYSPDLFELREFKAGASAGELTSAADSAKFFAELQRGVA